MAKVAHGVAGEPIVHSLSPLLVHLVHAHLSLVDKIKLPDLKNVAIIPTDGVENALAWAYAGAVPNPPDWELVGSPLGKFRANTLLQRAVDAAMEIVQADPRLPGCETPDQLHQTPAPGHDEVWMSITAPLKHQLTAAAVRYIDDSEEVRSVNTMRWDGRQWWAGTTDGDGFLMVAEAFGHSTDSVLGITGGGGTARSVAAAWCAAGGKVNPLGGRRTLDENGPWKFSQDEPALTIDFDDGGGDIIAPYGPMEGDFDSRIEHLAKIADGRWLLVAQHLIAWARLWSPENAIHLPSLSLIMTRIVAAEVYLA